MNKALRHTDHGTDTRQHRVSTSFRKPRKPVSDSGMKSETGTTRHQRKGRDNSPAPIWHNILYGIGAASVTLGPLLIPGVDYIDVMLGIAAVASAFFLLVSLAGIFQDFLPFGRQAQTGRHRRH